MYNKFDGGLAIVAVSILIYLSGIYTPERFEAVSTGQDVSTLVEKEKEPILDDEAKNDINLKLQAKKDNFKNPRNDGPVTEFKKKSPEQIERERRIEESKNEEQLAEDKRREEELEAEKQAENERDLAIAEDNQMYSEQMISELKQIMAGDPYNSGRYIDAQVTTEMNKVVVRVDESTFASLNLDLKKTSYEYASQEIQQIYLGYLDEYPEEVIVELEDSRGQNLSTYRHDIIGDRYVIQMNHNNDSNF